MHTIKVLGAGQYAHLENLNSNFCSSCIDSISVSQPKPVSVADRAGVNHTWSVMFTTISYINLGHRS